MRHLTGMSLLICVTLWNASFICVTCLIHTCDMPRSYTWHASSFFFRTTHSHTQYITSLICGWVWHDHFLPVTWLITLWHVLFSLFHPYVWHDPFTCVTHHILARDVTCAYAWHDSFMRVTRRAYAWHDSIMCVTCIFHSCDMPHSCVWHDSFIHMTWFIHLTYPSASNIAQS